MTGQQLEWLKQDLVRLEGKVDELLAFKWKLLGAGVVTSAVVGFIVQLILRAFV